MPHPTHLTQAAAALVAGHPRDLPARHGWLGFGADDGVIAHNDPDYQEKLGVTGLIDLPKSVA